MTLAGMAIIKACFDNPIEVYPVGDPRNRDEEFSTARSTVLPQLPQLPQQKLTVRKVLTDREDAFEERAAIMEYDGGFPRPLAEFLARR